MRNIENKRLPLDIFRIIGMMMIFIHHVGFYLPIKMPDLGARAVEVFVVLSGFLLTYRYYENCEIDSSFVGSFKFALKRIKKYYPLHILTFFAMFVFLGGGGVVTSILNILLLQSYSTNQEIYFGYNGVSWFLSAIGFSYFLFPITLQLLRKIKHASEAAMYACLLWIGIAVIQGAYLKYACWNDGYFFYIFPVFRYIQFLLGCLSGIWFIKRNIESGSFECCPKYRRKIAYLLIGLWGTSVFVCDGVWISSVYLGLVMLAISANSLLDYHDTYLQRLSGISFHFYLIHHVVILYYGRYGVLIFGNVSWKTSIFLMLFISLFLSFTAKNVIDMMQLKIMLLKKRLNI